MKSTNLTLWLLLASGAIAVFGASPPIIGTATSAGAFLINNAAVSGSATVLNGAAIHTAGNASEVRLGGGARLTLAASSGATVYRDRALLEAGAVALNSASGYRLEARSVRVTPLASEARIEVAMDGPNGVTVAARAGNAEVRSAAGVLIARVFPGEAMAFDAAPSGRVQFAGVLTRRGDVYLIKDDVTHVVAQLRGAHLAALAGKRISVTGTLASGTPQEGASEIVDVAQASVTPGAAGSGSAGGTAKPAAVSSGLSVRTIAIATAGIAGAGTLGGLAVAGTFEGSSVSR